MDSGTKHYADDLHSKPDTLPSRRWAFCRWLLVLTSLVFVALACRWPLVCGRAVPSWDADWFFAPQYIDLANHARAGQFLLWDPWTNAGTPSCAYTEIGTYSPLTILAALATGPTLGGYVIYWLGIWLLGGLGMLLLARHLEAPAWGGLAVTLGFLFCGFYSGHGQQTSWQYAFSALPWILWRLDVALRRRQALPAIEGGAIWGLSFMAGYPGVVLATGMMSGLWCLGRAISASRQRLRALVRAGGVLLLWGTVGLLVMSPTLLTFMKETPGYSYRNEPVPREVAVAWNCLLPQNLLSLANPYLSQWKAVVVQWEAFDPRLGETIYLGFVTCWLALAALLLRPKDIWRWWLAAIAALGLALALGPLLPLRGWLYDYCPPTRYFKHSTIFDTLTTFALFALAALAAADLTRQDSTAPRGRGIRLALAALLVSLSGIVGCWLARTIPGRSEVMPLAHIWPSALGWIIVMGLGAVGIIALSRPRWRPWFFGAICVLALADAAQTSRQTELLLSNCTPEAVNKWNERVREQVRSLDLAAGGGLDRGLEWPGSIWDPAGVKHLLARKPVLQAGSSLMSDFHLAWASVPPLRQAALGARRIWFSPSAVEIPWNKGTFHSLYFRSTTSGTLPMVLHRPEALARPLPMTQAETEACAAEVMRAPAAVPLDVSLLEYRPNTLAFRVDCPADGWLVVTDRWAPGWTATVNGQPTMITCGWFIFRAVPVRAGSNEICFVYRPWGHPWLVIVSYTTLCGVLVLSVRARRGRKVPAASSGQDPLPAIVA